MPEVKYAWREFKNDLIFSTWIGSEKEYSDDDIVIFNREPSIPGPFNFNYQRISTYNGLLKAKELGYTHALKIRSDYLPTNAKEFIKLLKPDKMNFLLWHYTSFLWLTYPTLNGYFTDHFSCGPIDHMLKMWNIEEVFCHSPEVMIVWSYISKLKNIIDVNYLLPYLNANNDIYYIKFNNITSHLFGHNSINTNFGNRKLYGRYESVFQNLPEYRKTPEETKKFMNNKYLNFLKYYNPLPKITIFNSENSKNFKDIIYPENKLEIVKTKNDIKGEYVLLSKDILNSASVIIEYFKKKEMYYSGTHTVCLDPGNITKSKLLTKEEFLND